MRNRLARPAGSGDARIRDPGLLRCASALRSSGSAGRGVCRNIRRHNNKNRIRSFPYTSSALSSVTVTVTASTTIDSWAIAYRRYTGCAASPLDPDTSLPVEATHETSGGGANPGVTGLSTTNKDDMIVLVCGAAFNSQFSLTRNHGSQIVEGGTAAGTWWASVSINEYSVPATQSSLTFNCTRAVDGWGAVGFALTADAAAASTQKFLMARPI
jgi:hypothetical protein